MFGEYQHETLERDHGCSQFFTFSVKLFKVRDDVTAKSNFKKVISIPIFTVSGKQIKQN